jgi:hypothetical protein
MSVCDLARTEAATGQPAGEQQACAASQRLMSRQLPPRPAARPHSGRTHVKTVDGCARPGPCSGVGFTQGLSGCRRAVGIPMLGVLQGSQGGTRSRHRAASGRDPGRADSRGYGRRGPCALRSLRCRAISARSATAVRRGRRAAAAPARSSHRIDTVVTKDSSVTMSNRLVAVARRVHRI